MAVPRGNSNGMGLGTATPFSANISTPTALQAEAISLLKNDDHRDIFTNLKMLRSISWKGLGLEYRPGDGNLSRRQVHALGVLVPCKDESIRSLLAAASSNSESGIETPDRSPLVPSKPASPSSYSMPGSSIPSRNAAAASPPLDFADQEGPSLVQAPSNDWPNQSSDKPFVWNKPAKTKYKYCCTFCGPSEHFTNASEWRTHERGHEVMYTCRLAQELKDLPIGSGCVLCGSFQLDENHLLYHNAHQCEKVFVVFNKKSQMVDHLRQMHKVPKSGHRGSIADRWRSPSGRQTWACGFCGGWLTHFENRLRHIHRHFSNHYKWENWSNTRVIRGLLRQTEFSTAWQRIMASRPGLKPSHLTWDHVNIDTLQLKLEVGPSDDQHAEALAKEAYNTARLAPYEDGDSSLADELYDTTKTDRGSSPPTSQSSTLLTPKSHSMTASYDPKMSTEFASSFDEHQLPVQQSAPDNHLMAAPPAPTIAQESISTHSGQQLSITQTPLDSHPKSASYAPAIPPRGSFSSRGYGYPGPQTVLEPHSVYTSDPFMIQPRGAFSSTGYGHSDPQSAPRPHSMGTPDPLTIQPGGAFSSAGYGYFNPQNAPRPHSMGTSYFPAMPPGGAFSSTGYGHSDPQNAPRPHSMGTSDPLTMPPGGAFSSTGYGHSDPQSTPEPQLIHTSTLPGGPFTPAASQLSVPQNPATQMQDERQMMGIPLPTQDQAYSQHFDDSYDGGYATAPYPAYNPQYPYNNDFY